MSERRTAADAGRAIADALRKAGYSHALGGALALGVAGVPRGTKDVDVNVFVEDSELPGVIACLMGLGIKLDEEACLARARRDGMFVGDWDGMRIDVFTPSIPFSSEAERTRVEIRADGWSGYFLAPEAIAIFKLLFYRLKDRGDLERLVAVRGELLDHAYIRRWIVEMMGQDDERVATWDDIVQRLAAKP
ncbi:MAG: hypothetical protein AAGF12_20840 [Myxococcota bacterium]